MTAATDQARERTPARSRAVPRPAGWSSRRKEFGDHLLSARFVVLGLIMALAAALPLYFLRRGDPAPRPRPRTDTPALFVGALRVVRAGQRPDHAAVGRRVPRDGRTAAGPGVRVRLRSTASGPTARCRGSSPSRSIATTSSTASSRRASRSSRSCSWRWSLARDAAFGLFRLGIVPAPTELVRIVLWVLVTIVYVAFWLAFGMLLSVVVRRAATSALVGFGSGSC